MTLTFEKENITKEEIEKLHNITSQGTDYGLMCTAKNVHNASIEYMKSNGENNAEWINTCALADLFMYAYMEGVKAERNKKRGNKKC